MKHYILEITAGFVIALTLIVIAMAASVDIPFIYQGF